MSETFKKHRGLKLQQKKDKGWIVAYLKDKGLKLQFIFFYIIIFLFFIFTICNFKKTDDKNRLKPYFFLFKKTTYRKTEIVTCYTSLQKIK